MRFDIRTQILALSIVGGLLIIGVLTVSQSILAVTRVRRQTQTAVSNVAATMRQTNIPLTLGTLKQIRGLSGFDFLWLSRLESGQLRFEATTLDGNPAGEKGVDADTAEAWLDTISSLPLKGTATSGSIDFSSQHQIGGRAYYVAPIQVASQDRLLVLIDCDDYDRQTQAAYTQPIWPGLFACAAISILGIFTANRISRKLRVVRDQVDDVARGQFRAVDVPRTRDEIHDLAVAANRMAEQLQRYERDVRSTERMETLGQMGRAVAHEIRNAVTGARLALDLHERSADVGASANTSVVRHQLTVMEQCAARFLAGEWSTPATVFALTDSLHSVVELCRPLAEHLDVGVELQELPTVRIRVGKFEFEQVMTNLIGNAIHAAADPRSCSGSARQVAVRADLLQDGLQIQVSDSGPGPSPEMAPRLFDAFSTDKADGLGLGLYLAQKSVDRWKGDIGWTRHEARTLFTMRLPAARVEEN